VRAVRTRPQTSAREPELGEGCIYSDSRPDRNKRTPQVTWHHVHTMTYSLLLPAREFLHTSQHTTQKMSLWSGQLRWGG
jgi:hypothetical protein